ncbi:MFS transporter [Pseudorhodoplanes sp.]|uniref:MFS transporter n=1 Tax=Pseudorhodoplanes sp. TaxID=1934341 RepID=UPI002CD29E8E|nr:MFS transporter [Pseudorhodoplanes sp.]HWV41280.1 MFS transporter [Pseudorhodoplanes sp.]
MTPTTIDARPTRSTDLRVIGLVGAAHFVSHIFILVLPPVFPFVRAEFGVSYTELGVVIAVFNVISALLQTPAGFLVDRTSARTVLVGGLLLGAASLAAAAAAPVFLLFGVAFAGLGLANTVYHPADYALLSNRVSAGRVGQAFSIHIFAGFMGTAITPAAMVFLATSLGWRGAFVAAALLGLIVAVAIMMLGEPLGGREAARAKAADKSAPSAGDWRVLATWPVVLNLIFFMLIASVSVGTQNYGIVALQALRGTTLSFSTTAITVYLMFSACAVLVGGWLVSRTERHEVVALIGLFVSGVALIPIAFIDLGTTILISLMAISGFANGVIQPSRDMIVRAVTPPGAFGRVFGFVTTGFNIGGVVAPPVFGYMMDVGSPASVIVGTALLSLAAIPVVLITVAQRPRAA